MDSYGWDFYYAWVQILLQMGPLLHFGPVITLVPSNNSQIEDLHIPLKTRLVALKSVHFDSTTQQQQTKYKGK